MNRVRRKPNFFLAGFPKCGTTSLAAWLSDHDNIFFSPIKEPNYFNTDSDHHAVFELSEYEALFDNVTSHHQAIGEGSVWSLASKEAIPNILRYSSNAKFLVCIRNPIEAAVSLHDQQVFSGEEPVLDFLAAWNLQDARKTRKDLVPRTCRDINHVLYGESCLFGRHLARLYTHVERDRVHIVLMDDIRKSPRQTYINVLGYLGVEDDGRTDFGAVNLAKERKWQWLAVLTKSVTDFKDSHAIRVGLGLATLLDRLNTRQRCRSDISPAVKCMLTEYFRSDIELCSQLIGRNLDCWLDIYRLRSHRE